MYIKDFFLSQLCYLQKTRHEPDYSMISLLEVKLMNLCWGLLLELYICNSVTTLDMRKVVVFSPFRSFTLFITDLHTHLEIFEQHISVITFFMFSCKYRLTILRFYCCYVMSNWNCWSRHFIPEAKNLILYLWNHN